MLHLASHTDPDWGRRAAENIDDVLLDHCHLEKKAASTALTLIFRYPEHVQLADPLSRLAREELSHFEEVLRHLQRRNIAYGRQRPSPYPGKLMKIVRIDEPHRLLDTMMCCALIEARSCERMKLLAESLTEPELVKLYKGLLACEARHHSTYIDLAKTIYDDEVVMQRLQEVAEHEAKVLTEMPTEPGMHNA